MIFEKKMIYKISEIGNHNYYIQINMLPFNILFSEENKYYKYINIITLIKYKYEVLHQTQGWNSLLLKDREVQNCMCIGHVQMNVQIKKIGKI